MLKRDLIEVVKKDGKFKVMISDPVKGPIFQSVKLYDNRANAASVAKAFAKRHDKRSFGVEITKDIASTNFTNPPRFFGGALKGKPRD